MITRICLIISTVFCTSQCASLTAPGELWVKRDRFGEGVIVDFRSVKSANQALWEEYLESKAEAARHEFYSEQEKE